MAVFSRNDAPKFSAVTVCMCNGLLGLQPDCAVPQLACVCPVCALVLVGQQCFGEVALAV